MADCDTGKYRHPQRCQYRTYGIQRTAAAILIRRIGAAGKLTDDKTAYAGKSATVTELCQITIEPVRALGDIF
jgi:hypothetical protein